MTIEDFYAKSSILVTGATGFLGKALIEKILRNCQGVLKIFVLLRSKRGKTIDERFDILIKSQIFNRIRSECPDSLDKVVPIEGDVSLPNLGLSSDDRSLLIQSVNIVFHSAATVRFDEPIKVSVNVNTRGTDRIIDLCKEMPNLVSFVHVSTAYCNGNLKSVKETIYRAEFSPEAIMFLSENFDDDVLQLLEERLKRNHPNTYTFTKNLTEQLISTRSKELPMVAIVRPSIIGASYKEPYPGWVDSINTLTGLIIEGGRGTIRSVLSSSKYSVDLIPLDIVVNTIICAAWHIVNTIHTQKSKDLADSTNLRIYNYTSGALNPISLGEIKELSLKYIRQSPSKYTMLYPDITFRKNQFMHRIAVVFTHFLPALVVDTIFKLRGRKPIMMKIAKKVHTMIKRYTYFNNEWNFCTENMIDLAKSVNSLSDKLENAVLFECDVKTVDWDCYFENYVLGIRQYILKDGPESLDRSRRKLKRLYWAQKGFQTFICVSLPIMFCISVKFLLG